MIDEAYLTIPNLKKWQHYKDRCPPWIKLHRDLLNDYKFSCLQDASKAHLLAIWLLASQMDNKIPNDSKWIERKINATQTVDLERLIADEFLHVWLHDSETLADSKQNADGEAEAEAEAETETTSYPEGRNNIGQRLFTTEDGTTINADTGEQITPFDEEVQCSI